MVIHATWGAVGSVLARGRMRAVAGTVRPTPVGRYRPGVSRFTAVVRPVPLSITRCEVTHIERQPIDPDRARAEHAAYVEALSALGADLVVLPQDDLLPDSVFVEDLLVDLGDAVVLTNPGAPSRRPERDAVRAAFAPGGVLAHHGPLVEMPDDLHLDGGDVLQVRGAVFVGRSTRTHLPAIEWLGTVTARSVIPVEVKGALHLKTAVTAATENLLVLDPDAVDRSVFRFIDVVMVPEGEEAAANVLRVPPRRERVTPDDRDERVLVPAGCPGTVAALRRWGVQVSEVAIPQLARAEAGLTCMSVLLGADFRFAPDPSPRRSL